MSTIPEEYKTIKQKVAAESDKCQIRGCFNLGKWDNRSNRYYLTKGLCQAHYHKLVRYGDPNYQNKNRVEHGLSSTPEYEVWQNIKGRCYNPNNPNYKNYGAKGVGMCKRWRESFEAFLEDMGERPGAELSVDRIDVNKGYKPSNCRWATVDQQANNRRVSVYIEHDGMRMTAKQWSNYTGIAYSTIRRRHQSGWSDKDIITKPIKKIGKTHDWPKQS